MDSRLLVALIASGVLAIAGAAPASAGTLLHRWKADGNAVDAVRGNNGTLVGDTGFANGHTGRAFSFDGSDDYVSVPDAATHYPAGSFTVDAWAKTSVASGPGQIVTKYDCAGVCSPTDSNSVWEIEVRDGKAFGYVRDANGVGPDIGGQLITGGPSIADGNFHHIAFIRDVEAGKLSLYVDGSLAVEEPLDPNVAGPLRNLDGEADPLTIGAQIEGGTTTPFEEITGQVDEVRFWRGVEVPALPAPALGATANVRAVRGKVLVGIPSRGARAAQKGVKFVPLEEARSIPIGSFLDTTKGTVALTTARNRAGKVQSGRFTAGLFQVLQSRKQSAKGLTELTMKGSAAGFRSCGSNASASALSSRTVRRLRGNAKGRYRTRGRHSAATVRGTTWTVADRCDGTLTTVKRGEVAVRDFRLKKTITVTAGKSYLAR